MKKSAFLLLTICWLPVISDNAIAAAEVPLAEIIHFAPWESHVDILTNTPFVNSEACGRGIYYRINLAKPGANAKLSTLLAAFMSGKKVELHISGCVGHSPEILGVRVF